MKTLQLARELRRCADPFALVLVLLSFSSGAALADNAATVLTLDGQIQPIATSALPPLGRWLLAEDGTLSNVDEYAVFGANGKVAYASKGWVSATLNPPSDGDREGSAGPVLLIEHQQSHEHNDRYSPMPTAAFTAQPVRGPRQNTQRGFAVISIGQSGDVLSVKVLSQKGEIRDYELYEALARGIATSFPDTRRHDHTVYLAYEVRAGTVQQIGAPLVTMPFCQVCDHQ